MNQWKVPLLSGGILLAVGLYVLHRLTSPNGPNPHNTAAADATVLDPHAVAAKPRPAAASARADKGTDLAPAPSPSAPAASASAAHAALTTEAAALIASSSQGTAQVLQVIPVGDDAAAVEYATQGRRGLAWVDLKRKWVILGTVLNAQGQNLQAGSVALAAATGPADEGSAPQGPAAGPGPASAGAAAQGSPAAVRAAMMQAVGVAQGPKDGVPIWVFVDPDSARSAKFFNAESSKVVPLGAWVNWVPVAYEDQQSAGRVAYILTQLDPMRALTRNFRDFNTAQNKGAVDSVTPSVAMAQVAMKNTQLLSNVSALETPTVLFCGKDGAPHVLTSPTDLAAVVQIAGHCNLPTR